MAPIRMLDFVQKVGVTGDPHCQVIGKDKMARINHVAYGSEAEE